MFFFIKSDNQRRNNSYYKRESSNYSRKTLKENIEFNFESNFDNENVEKIIEQIPNCKNIIIMNGAGISTCETFKAMKYNLRLNNDC